MKKLSFIFPGQGSQTLGMGEGFYKNSAVAREMFEEASESIKVDFKNLLFNDEEKLNISCYTQPAILLISSIAHRLFEDELNIKPYFALGHSLGEFSALISVKAISLSNAIKVVHNRGKWMQESCEGKSAGMMVVLGLDDSKVEEICEDAIKNNKLIYPANYNSDGQIVLAGNKGDLKEYESVFKNAGAKRAMLLNMSVASHCPILQSAVEPLRNILQDTIEDNFISPIISNVTAMPYKTKKEALDLLPKQLVMPVKYKHSILSIEKDIDMFIEFGNGSVLKGLNKKITKVPTFSANSIASLEDIYQKVED
jgi:[acyl-carrier-protein] S-malonyltransferase